MQGEVMTNQLHIFKKMVLLMMVVLLTMIATLTAIAAEKPLLKWA